MQKIDRNQMQSATGPGTFSKRRAFFIAALFAPGAGLAAALISVVVMGIFSVTAGIATPVEIFGDYILKHISVDTFLRLLTSFGALSKKGPLGLALLGMIALGTALGWLYATIVRVKLPVQGYRPARREWLTAAGFALIMSLLAIVLFVTELRQNFFGLPIGWATFTTALALIVDFTAYAVTLCFVYRALLPKSLAEGTTAIAQQNRRQLLTRGGIAALTVGAGAATVGLIDSYLSKYTSYDGMKTALHNKVTAPITPNNEHYIVTQNPVDPRVNIDLWQLEVTGLVNQAGTYTFAEIQKLPSISRPITLECIANGLGDHLIGTAIWQGVTLRTLLEHHGGAQAPARYAAFYGVDGYTVSLPLNEVLEADALLAWRMNGTDLPTRHGYPMRVLIPGRYGEENPKWLTRVELTDHFVPGLYSDQGWYNGPLHTMTRIDVPRDMVPLGQAVMVSGIAFAGNRGIQKVELSLDGGKNWQETTLDPALSPDSWVFWKQQWQPTNKGNYMLVARATDGTGEVQTSKKQGTVPNGSTGYHTVNITVG